MLEAYLMELLALLVKVQKCQYVSMLVICAGGY